MGIAPLRQPVALIRAAACIALAFLAACAPMSKKPTGPDLKAWPEVRSDFRVEALRLRMHEYSINFAAEVDLAAAAIERRGGDAAVRRNALLWRARAVPEMRKACFRLQPVGALVDAWIFARQMDQFFNEGAGAAAFGTLQPEAVETSRRLVRQMREIGGSITVSPEATLAFEQKFIDPWLAEHPLSDLTFVRESPIARFAEQSPAAGDIRQSVGTMEELAISVSQQARIYLADLPRQVRGEVDLMRADMLPSQDVASMQRDLHVSAAAADRLAATAESVAPLVLAERQIVLDEISRQRILIMDALSVERARTVGPLIGALATERAELLRSFESQRLATLEWATAERREAIAEMHRELAGSVEALDRERAIVVDDVNQIVNGVLLRVALFLLAAVLLAPLVAHAYARVWPRRPAEKAARQPV